MTSNRKIKRVIRSYMAETGLNYLEARLTLEISGELPRQDGAEPTVFEHRHPLGQVVTVTSSRGGTGKTTVALSLASYISKASKVSVARGAAKDPLKVIVLDLDVRDGQIGVFTGFWKPTVMRLKRYGISKSEIEGTKVHDEGLEVDLMLAPRRPRSADELPPEFYRELIEELKSSYDYIIIDTASNYLDPTVERVAYPLADFILMVTEASKPSLFSMARWIREVTSPLDQHGMAVPKDKIGIVVNRATAERALLGKDIVANAQELPIISVIPDAPKIVGTALNEVALERIISDYEIGKTFGKIAESIVGRRYPLDRPPVIESVVD